MAGTQSRSVDGDSGWSGKSLLSWKLDYSGKEMVIGKEDGEERDSFEFKGEVGMGGQDSDFVMWSKGELGWRSSFSDLIQAYALQKSGLQCDGVSLRRSSSSQSQLKLSISNDTLDEAAPLSLPQASKVAPQEDAVIEAVVINHDTNITSTTTVTVEVQEAEVETDNDHISLEDIALEEISLEPMRGDFYDSDTDSYLSLSLDDGESGSLTSGDRESLRSRERNGSMLQQYRKQTQRRYRFRKVLVPSQEQLESLDLQDGENEIEFELEGFPPLRANLFVWSENAKIVVTEIDGVVKDRLSSNKQKQGMKGWVPFLGGGGTAAVCFEGSIELFNDLANRGYHIIYLVLDGQEISNYYPTAGSSKEKQPVNASKAYLSSFRASTASANSKAAAVSLPSGPILRSPESLVRGANLNMNSLVFRSAALRGVRHLFPSTHNPYHACFATTDCDMVCLLFKKPFRWCWLYFCFLR